MNRHERGLEFKVGAFVFVGLAMLGALVVQFGRLGEGFKTYYALTVRFSDASGLLKGSDVLLAGAKIGKVSGGPRMVREGAFRPILRDGSENRVGRGRAGARGVVRHRRDHVVESQGSWQTITGS